MDGGSPIARRRAPRRVSGVAARLSRRSHRGGGEASAGAIGDDIARSGQARHLRRRCLVRPGDQRPLLRRGLGRGVQTEVRVTELVEPYLHQIMAMRFDPRRIARQVGRAVRSWDHFISGLPDDLRAILEQIRTGTVGIDFRIHDVDHAVDRLVDGLVTAASIMAGAQLISRRTAPLVGRVVDPWTPRRRRRCGHVAAAHHTPQAARHVGHPGTQGPRHRSELTTRRAASAPRVTTITGRWASLTRCVGRRSMRGVGGV